VLLFHPESGQLRGVVAANYLTGLRTGAAGAVAARALARAGARRIGLIGAGVQAEMQLRCLAATRPIEQVLVWSVGNGVVESFIERTRDLGLTITAMADPEAVVRGAEILVTTTPSFEPIVQAEWLHAGLHINAIGSDTKGKQELATQAVLRADRIVVDSYEQASELGELQHPVRAGLIERSRVTTLGEVLTGQSAGRQSEAEITLFDATGLIMQDLVVANHVWQQVNG
jgi:ornithine cyclodeaminase